jgi:predicted RNA-binding protein with PIN domain
MTTRHDASPTTAALPVPETLLMPLLEVAAEMVTRLSAAEMPAVLRPLAGFDRRRLTTSSPARQQLRKALDADEDFREQVVERFREKAAVVAALEGWTTDAALALVEDAAARADLPLLASTLYAARPRGWTFGLGMVCAAAALERTEKEREDDAKAADVRLASVDEARRRAEEARDAAAVEATRLENELKEERRARRERERHADDDVEEAERRRRDAETVAERARAEADDAQARLVREGERARDAEQRLRALRREIDERTQTREAEPEPLTRREVDALATAAEAARQVAAALEGLTRRARDSVASAAVVPAADMSVHMPAAEAPARPTNEPAEPGGLPRRTRALCPPGMQSDTPEALDAMLRTRGVVLVVDGYNVSMAAWEDAEPLDQRERLLAALERLHLRMRCDVVVVFDGADVGTISPPRRAGVRVMFSAAGEEADPVIVREVAALPRRVPVIVASSDKWVREHAEAEGATAVSKAALLDVLRR